MTRSPIKPTSTLIQQIRQYVLAGRYAHIAAAAAGVPSDVFEVWMQRGRQARAGRIYRELVQEISQAEAQARLVSETSTFRDEPLKWLCQGPGREVDHRPGWSTPPRPHVEDAEKRISLLVRREVQSLLRFLTDLVPSGNPLRPILAEELMNREQKAGER